MDKPTFTPKDPDFIERVTGSFNKQTAMSTLNISLKEVGAGHVTLSMPYQTELCQQHGFIHAGIITTALDSACGYAGFSLMSADAAVLSVEFKTNLLAPAAGETFEFIGEVLKPGSTITVVEGKAYAIISEQRKLIASMNCTLMALVDRGIKH